MVRFAPPLRGSRAGLKRPHGSARDRLCWFSATSTAVSVSWRRIRPNCRQLRRLRHLGTTHCTVCGVGCWHAGTATEVIGRNRPLACSIGAGAAIAAAAFAPAVDRRPRGRHPERFGVGQRNGSRDGVLRVSRAVSFVGGCGSNPRWARILSIAGRPRMISMKFILPESDLSERTASGREREFDSTQ